jgi:muconate cycloisomerase
VRVDINQAWSEATASAMLPALAAAGVELIEQPVAQRNLGALARLARETPVAIMADEALNGPETAFAIAAQAGADVFALKIEQSGGLLAAAKVAAIAEAAGIGLYGGTMLEGGIGTAASAHLFSTIGKLDWGTELFGPLLLTEEVLETPLDYADFGLAVPTAPGLGVALSEAQLNRFRRDRAERSLHVLPRDKMGS